MTDKTKGNVVKLVPQAQTAAPPQVLGDLNAAFNTVVRTICASLQGQDPNVGLPNACRAFLTAFETYQKASGDHSGGFPMRHFDYGNAGEDRPINTVLRGALTMVAALAESPPRKNDAYFKGQREMAEGIVLVNKKITRSMDTADED
jgi:hypothetical protein